MGREFKAIPGYTGSSRPAWDTREPVLLCFVFKVSCLEGKRRRGEGAGRPLEGILPQPSQCLLREPTQWSGKEAAILVYRW